MKPDLFDFIEKHNLHDAVREKVRFYAGLAEVINTFHALRVMEFSSTRIYLECKV